MSQTRQPDGTAREKSSAGTSSARRWPVSSCQSGHDYGNYVQTRAQEQGNSYGVNTLLIDTPRSCFTIQCAITIIFGLS